MRTFFDSLLIKSQKYVMNLKKKNTLPSDNGLYGMKHYLKQYGVLIDVFDAFKVDC